MADHVHLWTAFDPAGPLGREPVRHCIVCLVLQTWGEAIADREPGLWWNHSAKRLEDCRFGDTYARRALDRAGWCCSDIGHLMTLGSEACVVCGVLASDPRG